MRGAKDDDKRENSSKKKKKRPARDSSASPAVQIDSAALHEKIESVAAEKAELGDDVWHPNADQARHNEFRKARKEHYNEFQVAQMLAKKLAQEDEDDDDDDANADDDDDGE